MGRTVEELLDSISFPELIEWYAYWEIEPFGEERDDLRTGIVAATFANANRRKGRRPFQASDFMPKFGKRAKRQTMQEQLEIVKSLNTAFGGQVIRRELNGS